MPDEPIDARLIRLAAKVAKEGHPPDHAFIGNGDGTLDHVFIARDGSVVRERWTEEEVDNASR